MKLLNKIFGSKNDRYIKKLGPVVSAINQLESRFSKLTDQELAGQTAKFRERLDNGAKLDDFLIEAFATCREASKRVLNMRHYDCQLIGGFVLHHGKIAEMKTGEGKTLVATLPLYLNGLAGKGSHLITVNDYLAKRDSEWMGKIYQFLGLSVGNIVHGMDDDERRDSYGCDITYGTNNEFGFDYLRDNMKFSLEDYVQRNLQYSIIDEVDSILIDEARTPLIISGQAEESSELYYRVDTLMPFMQKDRDFIVDEKNRSAELTEDGCSLIEKRLKLDNLYSPRNINVLHHVMQALKAHHAFKKGVDYVVENNKVVIVDEFTGRKMEGRRWSDGLHQAVEAKEGVVIENESQTLATITYQNYFRLYNKLAGMTGTAETEAPEFSSIYKLEVICIPPNKPVVRRDDEDVIYKSEREKFEAIAKDVKTLYEEGSPVLIGTTSVEKSEVVGKFLSSFKVKHSILNAKNHAREADIVAQAGSRSAVTVATNMAGRGTDILLGGNPEFLTRKAGFHPEDENYQENLEKFIKKCEEERENILNKGGLHIIGTERHESRRIDNQLRGRAGRQGDPGFSRFYLSLEDDLLRLFGSDRIKGLMERLGMEDGEPIYHSMVTKSVANAQTRVEGRNFESRKHVLEYDDVMDQQRKTIYGLRRTILEESTDMSEKIKDLIDEQIYGLVQTYAQDGTPPDLWDIEGMESSFTHYYMQASDIPSSEVGSNKDLAELLYKKSEDIMRIKYNELGEENFSQISRYVYLSGIDHLWKEHLKTMDHLKQGIGLRGYGQKKPSQEYKKEGFELFRQLMQDITNGVIEKLLRVQLVDENEEEEDLDLLEEMRHQQLETQELSGESSEMFEEEETQREAPKQQPYVREYDKVGRNDPCPCGSGKKYKKCHLPLQKDSGDGDSIIT